MKTCQSVSNPEATLHFMETNAVFELMFAAGSVVGQHSTTHAGAALNLAPWQVINLVGAPALALLFARPVVDDVKAWLRSLSDRE